MQTLWSYKGGVGVTVVASMLAASHARRDGDALLVDLCGDAAAVLGLAEPDGPGVRDWLATGSGSAQALSRLAVPVAAGLTLLPCGDRSVGSWDGSRPQALAAALGEWGGHVVVDAGCRIAPSAGPAHLELVAALCRAGRSLVVTRPCYLALRRAVSQGVDADGVILVDEPGRALGRARSSRCSVCPWSPTSRATLRSLAPSTPES